MRVPTAIAPRGLRAGKWVTLLAAVSLAMGCDEPGDCRVEAWDCFCGSFGAPERRCQDLTTVKTCEPVAIDEPCRYGSDCRYGTEICPDTCLERLQPDGEWVASCGTAGLTFGGPAGLVVGAVLDVWTGSSHPAVLIGEGYGATWTFAETPARPGCEAEAYEQLVAPGPETLWVLSRGTGPACPPRALATRDGGATWIARDLPETGDATGAGPPRLSVDPAAPDWLAVTGASPTVSQDGGASFASMLLPLVDPGDGTLVPTAVAHAAVRGDPESDVCVATAGTPAVIACGPADGSAWTEEYRTAAPILALGFAGSALRSGWALAGGAAGGLLASTGGAWLPGAAALDLGEASTAIPVWTEPDTLMLVLLSAAECCDALLVDWSSAGDVSQSAFWALADRFSAGLLGPFAAFAQAPGRLLVARSAQGPEGWPSVVVNTGYPMAVSGAAPSGRTVVAGMVAGIRGPVTPPWTAP